jgi:hypothetical protein
VVCSRQRRSLTRERFGGVKVLEVEADPAVDGNRMGEEGSGTELFAEVASSAKASAASAYRPLEASARMRFPSDLMVVSVSVDARAISNASCARHTESSGRPSH